MPCDRASAGRRARHSPRTRPVYAGPDENRITEEKIALSRRLFFDRRLSRDQSLSCASCHDPARAFSSNRPVAIGVFGRVGRRNAPALVNRGYARWLFWDGRVTSLEEQALLPIQDPDEMGLTLEEAQARVGLSPAQISRALASYVRSLLSGNAPLDRFVAGERGALSPEQQAGLRVFRTRGNCTACHVGPTLTDERFHNTGVAWRAVPDGAGPAGSFSDEGRFHVTGNPTDRGAFRTPTLREVARTAPYMHDGSLSTLDEVIEFYDAGGRKNPLLSGELRPLGLTAAEKRSLVAFLRSLTGENAR